MKQLLIWLGLKKKLTAWSVHRNSLRDENRSIEILQDPEENMKDTFLFFEAIWPVWVVGQVFGIMPLSGVSSASISKLEFKWKSKRSIYSYCVALILAVYIVMLLSTFFGEHNSARVPGISEFFFLNTINLFCFLALALKWPMVMKYWMEIDRKLPSFDTTRQKRRFVWKIRSVAFGFLFFALVEYISDTVAEVYFVLVCKGKNPLIEHVRSYTLYKEDVEISALEAIFVRIAVIPATFVWTYRDVFLITISMALSSQIRLFNTQLKRTKEKHVSKEFWTYQREQWLLICDLVRTVNNAITILILLSFADNMFYVCKQLFMSLKPIPTVFNAVYFWYSLAFLIVRMSTMAFSASRISDESKKPIHILSGLSSQSWNTDTERFFNEVTTDNIAFTGMGFFAVTRQMILSLSYNIGIDAGYLPKVPYFTFLLYSVSTATLFHAATLEPTNLRSSYWKFLHSLSGGRMAAMARKPLDVYGLQTSMQLAKVLAATKTSKNVKFSYFG